MDNKQVAQEFFKWLNQYPIDEWLDKLKEAGKEARIDGLVEAIEICWQEASDQLTEEDFIGAQEASVGVQFGEDYVRKDHSEK